MKINNTIIALLLIFISTGTAFSAEAFYSETDVFVSGTNNVDTYRIPVMETTSNGVLLAFCEARKESSADHTPTSIMLRRSLDDGASWQDAHTIIDAGEKAMMAPTVVIDRETQKIFLFVKNVDDQRVLLFQSIDDGATWIGPDDITSQVGAVGLGPNTGIQLKGGRLVIPVASGSRSHIMYSDNHGLTWKNGSRVDTPEGTNECTVVELADGRLMLNMRPNDARGCRIVAISNDGGNTWGQPYDEAILRDHRCNASIKRFTKEKNGDDCNRILFSNCANEYTRKDFTVRVSYDEGQSWAFSKLVHPDYAGYSSLSILSDNTIGLLYEKGDAYTPYKRIVFARFNIEWITDNVDSLGSCKKQVLCDTDFENWVWSYDDISPNLDGISDCQLEVCTTDNNKTLKVTSYKGETAGDSWCFNHGIILEAQSYEPQKSGAIESLSLSVKHERLDDSAYQVFLPLIEQDGKYFVYSDGTLWVDSANDGVYAEFNVVDLISSDWAQEKIDGAFSPDVSSNPDFSVEGTEIKFGLLVRAGGKKTDAMNALASFDDFKMIVNSKGLSRCTVKAAGHLSNIRENDDCIEVDFKDYVMPNPAVDNGVRLSVPSPFMGFLEPSSDYTTKSPLPESVGVILTTRNQNADTNVLFKDGSTGRIYSPLYGTRNAYSNYDEIEFKFVSTQCDINGEYEKAVVSNVGFVFESALAASLRIRFYNLAGNEIFSDEFVPTGIKSDIAYASCNQTGFNTAMIHRIVISPAQGYDNNDYWSMGSTLGLPANEPGLVFSGYEVTGNCPTADLNGDCLVNVYDLMVMAKEWMQ